jgi:hypothetical protein
MDFGNLEIGIDGRVHRDDGRIAAEDVDKRAEVGTAH